MGVGAVVGVALGGGDVALGAGATVRVGLGGASTVGIKVGGWVAAGGGVGATTAGAAAEVQAVSSSASQRLISNNFLKYELHGSRPQTRQPQVAHILPQV